MNIYHTLSIIAIWGATALSIIHTDNGGITLGGIIATIFVCLTTGNEKGE